MTSMKRVAVIGASGYGGLQSIRLLKDHPYFKVTYLGGERSAGKKWNEICKTRNDVANFIDTLKG